MTQPTPYDPSIDFSDEEAAGVGGRSTVRTAALDAEFSALALTLSELLTNLAVIQRDDTQLRDGVVGLHALASEVYSLMALSGVTIADPLAWQTATDYAAKTIVTEAGGTYMSTEAHTSGTFATDLAAGLWVLIAPDPGVLSAAATSFSPAGGIAATDVQAAIEELDAKKCAKSANLSDVTAATARTNLAVPGLGTANTFTKTQTLAYASIASAAALELGDGNSFLVTGTTTIISILTKGAGTEVALIFEGSLTLTHNAADLILPTGANIATAAGDVARFLEYAAGQWRCTGYQRAGFKGELISRTVVTSTSTYNVPAGAKALDVQVQAPGGGGAGANSAGTETAAGGGGGGGGYARRLITSGFGTTVSCTIGAVGAGGTSSGGGGGTGGTTSFASFCSATGGAGGTASTSGATPLGGVGGGGAGGAGSSGDFNISGGPGEHALRFGASSIVSGRGGDSMLGRGAASVRANGGSAPGVAGQSYGGGGAGGASYDNDDRSGGAGGAGVIIVDAYR